MGVLGPQALVTLICAAAFQKLSPIYSFGKYLVCGRSLYKFLPPTDESLRKPPSSGDAKAKPDNKSRNRKQQNNGVNNGGTFTISKSQPIALGFVPFTIVDANHLRYYDDIVNMVDFLLPTIVVVITTCLYTSISPPLVPEYGLNCIWCIMLFWFSLKPLLVHIASFKKDENSGELVLIFMSAFFHLVISMILIITNEKYLNFDIISAHDQFVGSAEKFLRDRGIDSVGPASLLTFRIVLALISALIGGILTFPGMRLAKTHLQSLQYCEGRMFRKLVLYIDVLLPLYILSLWIPPLSSAVIIGKTVPYIGEITSTHYTIYRGGIICLFVLIRFYTSGPRLQAHLNSAHSRITKLQSEAGRISNTAIKALVTNINQYLGAVSVQLIAPICMLMALVLLSLCFITPVALSQKEPPKTSQSDNPAKVAAESIAAFTATLAQIRSVFSEHLLGSVTSYMTFTVMWCLTFNTYAGLAYHSYISDS